MPRICGDAPLCGHALCMQFVDVSNVFNLSMAYNLAAARQCLPIPRPLPVPKRTSSLSGYGWMCELMEGNDHRFFEQMRMKKHEFTRFTNILKEHCDLGSCGRLDPLESIGMFMKIVGSGFSFSDVGERFQHSGETVHQHFHHVLNSMCSFGDIMIAPIIPKWGQVPSHVSSDPRYSPYFDGCLGAIDGTHVQLRIPEGTSTVAWFDRHGVRSTAILAVVDFDMCFTFADIGKEGSMHDARLLMEDMRSASRPFPFPPCGKYYLADSGFPEMLGFMTPYKEVRYHMPAFRESRRIRSPEENFNVRHSSLRSVVERTFGVLKNKWRILHRMAQFDVETQIKVIWACFGLHNLCRRIVHDDFDAVFDYLLQTKYMRIPNGLNRGNPLRPEYVAHGARVMNHLRDIIKDSIPFDPVN